MRAARPTLLSALITVLIALPARGQDEVAQLRRELAEAQARIAALEQQRDVLMQQLTQTLSELAALRAARGEDEPAAAPELPLDPFACPDSMLAEVQRRYQREIAPLPAGTAPEKRRRQEELVRWIKTSNRTLRSHVRWRVAVSELRPAERGDDFDATMAIIDPATNQPIGRAFRVVVPGRFAARILYEQRFEQWDVSAMFIADLRHRPERLEPGVFDAPPFVGPEVEFGYTLDWEGLAGFDPQKPVKPAPADAPPPADLPASPSPPR